MCVRILLRLLTKSSRVDWNLDSHTPWRLPLNFQPPCILFIGSFSVTSFVTHNNTHTHTHFSIPLRLYDHWILMKAITNLRKSLWVFIYIHTHYVRSNLAEWKTTPNAHKHSLLILTNHRIVNKQQQQKQQKLQPSDFWR